LKEAKVMSDETAIIDANARFYDAFAAGDEAAMAALWGEESSVACIHPGGPALFGRDAVLESWRAILANPNRPRIRCHAPHAFVQGEGAFVICYEEVEGGLLVATNLFRREAGTWRMIHHQAGPTVGPPAARETADGGQTVH
jgi:ketosteroid isomerase-like protein